MPVVGGQAEPELSDGVAPVGQQSLPERRIGPGLRDHARAVFGNPFFFGEVLELFDEFARLHPPLIERGFDGGRSLLTEAIA